MSSSDSSDKRSSMRPRPSYDTDIYRVIHSGGGLPIQCQFCPGQQFRRSRIRWSADIEHLLLMRYPVRCLRCSQRQLVSFTVAGISVPSHVKQRRARRAVAELKHWSEPEKAAAEPQETGVAEEISSVRTGDTV